MAAMTPEPFERSDIWFNDGSIILVVENTGFRVHQSILGQHSDVFAGLFTLPQPSEKEKGDFIDGCPFVHLQDDLVDFTETMKAIYQPFYFDQLAPDAKLHTLLQFVSGILKISTKYNLIFIRQKCISILTSKFPTTLHGADALVASGYQYHATTIVRSIPLARETNVPALLPWAFYISTNIETEALLADPVLSWKDKALCLAGKGRLWERQKEDTHRFMFNWGNPECRERCGTRMQLQQMTWRAVEDLRKHVYPLTEYDEWDSLNVCGGCVQRAQLDHSKGREKVWNDLPKIFNLGTWEEILAEQNR